MTGISPSECQAARLANEQFHLVRKIFSVTTGQHQRPKIPRMVVVLFVRIRAKKNMNPKGPAEETQQLKPRKVRTLTSDR